MCWRQSSLISGIFRGKLNNHTHIIFRWDLKPRADLCYLEGFSSYSLLWCQVPVEGAELGWAKELVVSEHGGTWGILKETLRWPNFWSVFSEQTAPRETCICLRQRKPLFDVPAPTTLMSESWGLQGYLFPCLFPSSSTVPGRNAWHRWGGGDLQPNNQDSQECPIQLASPHSSGIRRILSALPWACTTSGMWLLKGHTRLRSKERFWDVRFRTKFKGVLLPCVCIRPEFLSPCVLWH